MAPCLKRLDADCFRSHPAWAKQAFAYRLVHLLTPKPLTKRLPKALRLALIAPGVEVPPGVEFPAGVVVSPGAEVPAWSPGDPPPPGVAIEPTASFPPGWSPADPLPEGVTLDPGAEIPAGWTPPDPLPSGVRGTFVLPPGAQYTGPFPPLYTGIGEAGPPKIVPQQAYGEPWLSLIDHGWWTCGAGCTAVDEGWDFHLPYMFSSGILFRQTNSGWYQDFRPSAIRLTYTGGPINRFVVRDEDNMDICVPSDTTLASEEIRPLVYAGGKDIDSFVVKTASDEDVLVTNIEFYTG